MSPSSRRCMRFSWKRIECQSCMLYSTSPLDMQAQVLTGYLGNTLSIAHVAVASRGYCLVMNTVNISHSDVINGKPLNPMNIIMQ